MLKSIYYYFFKEVNECFICCTKDGKTQQEITFEMAFNQKKLNYPLINLSSAYNCACINILAHNKCLLNIKKCPTCRKIVTKHNLYVKTNLDYYLKYYFDWIKKRCK